MISLIEIDLLDVIKTPSLIKRANESSKSDLTVHYLAISEKKEIAFISIDRWHRTDCMVLYELFVPKDLRNKGFGRLLLAKIEQIAKQEGFSTVRLNPNPLEEETNKKSLIAWYRKSGYSFDPSSNGEMIKIV